MQDSQVTSVQVETFDRGARQVRQDFLAVEEPLEMILASPGQLPRKVSITMRTPGNDEELALGFLFTEGIIGNYAQVASVKHSQTLPGAPGNTLLVELNELSDFNPEKLNRNFYTTSSCGVCGKASIEAIHTAGKFTNTGLPDLNPDPDILTGLPSKLRLAQETFEKTGGLHASAIFSCEGELILLREDVGRHNALDKLIGRCLMENMLPLNAHILLLSGRASFELIQKAAMAGIRCVAAVGAPSSLAVETARSFGIQLFGFVKDDRFNQYSE